MSRERILAEIRRLADSQGGKPPGQERFSRATGIAKADWYGKYWVRWSDAVRAAGFEPNRLSSATPDDLLLQKLAEVVKALGHFPVSAELRMRARSDPTFPDETTFSNRLGNKAKRASRLQAWCRERGMDDIADLCSQHAVGREDAPSRALLETGSVYLLKSGRYYKIGRSNSVGRRERELAIQLPEKARVVHVIETDDPAGIEAYWPEVRRAA
jgi:hypothetical protein